MTNEIVSVPFHGDVIEAIKDSRGQIFIVPKRICESLGVAFQRQRSKLEEGRHWSGITIMVTPDPRGRPQQTCVIPLGKLPMWMATLTLGKVGDHLKEKLKLYQIEASEVLEQHFFGGTSRPVYKPWSERFSETMCAHVCYVNQHYLGYFTVVTSFVSSILCMEDEMLRHAFEVRPSDRPDISMGSCWSNYRKSLGWPEVKREAPLYLPDQRITVPLRVYDPSEELTCRQWFVQTYLTTKLIAYIDRKPEFHDYTKLSRASLAQNTCHRLAGRDAVIDGSLRKQLNRAGGFVSANAPRPVTYQQATLF